MTTAKQLRAQYRARGRTVDYGWCLDGVGPARFGWYECHPCCVSWIGKQLPDLDANKRAIRAAASELQEWRRMRGQDEYEAACLSRMAPLGDD